MRLYVGRGSLLSPELLRKLRLRQAAFSKAVFHAHVLVLRVPQSNKEEPASILFSQSDTITQICAEI